MGEESSHTKAWGLLGNCWVSALCPDLPSPECGNVLGSSELLSLRRPFSDRLSSLDQPWAEVGAVCPPRVPSASLPAPKSCSGRQSVLGTPPPLFPESVSPRSASTGLEMAVGCAPRPGHTPSCGPASSREDTEVREMSCGHGMPVGNLPHHSPSSPSLASRKTRSSHGRTEHPEEVTWVQGPQQEQPKPSLGCHRRGVSCPMLGRPQR